jgi:hypothetical protein
MTLSTDVTDEYKGFLRVWSLVDGQPRAIVDAVPLDHPFAARIKKLNARVKVLAGEAEVLEAAQRIRVPDAPVAPTAPVEPVLQTMIDAEPVKADFATTTDIDGVSGPNPNQQADYDFALATYNTKKDKLQADFDAATVQYNADVSQHTIDLSTHATAEINYATKSEEYAAGFADHAAAQTVISGTPNRVVKLATLRAGAPAKMVPGATEDDPPVVNPDWTEWARTRVINDVLKLLSQNIKMLVEQEPPRGHALHPHWVALAKATNDFMNEVIS